MTKPVVVPTTMEKSMYKKGDSKKVTISDLDDYMYDDEEEEENDDFVDVDIQTVEPEIEIEPEELKPKKKRGRPRKNPIVEDEEPKPKKKRGRPRKNPIVEKEPEEEIIPKQKEEAPEEINILPGFEDDDDDLEEEFDYTPSKPVQKVEKETPKISPKTSFRDDYYDDDDDDFSSFSKHSSVRKEEIEFGEQPYINNNINVNQVENRDNRPSKGSMMTVDDVEERQSMRQYENNYDDSQLDSLLTGDRKIVTFVGTSKNGTSFIVNNIAQILSSIGINTAILDATQNKNAYYIYTKNDEELRKVALNSIEYLINKKANGITANNNLTIYTSVPGQDDGLNNSYAIMETLLRNHSIILVDCDFNTPMEYFEKSQEIYLVQSMDVLTIQPLTEFLRDLKTQNILDEGKVRIILNKILKVKGITGRNIIGGMSNYNDPEMSFMTELFNRNTVKVAGQIPFDEDVYANYLKGLIECDISINGYPKEFKNHLSNLAEVIYPLLPTNRNMGKKSKKGNKGGYNQYSDSFSTGMNNTLNNMRNKY